MENCVFCGGFCVTAKFILGLQSCDEGDIVRFRTN